MPSKKSKIETSKSLIPLKTQKVKQPVSQMMNLPKDYLQLLAQIKDEINKARVRASLSANSEMVQLYWKIGKGILSRQQQEGWGAKVIERLSKDLSQAFTDMKGFTPRNLHFMRAFAEAYEEPIGKQLVSLIPWGA